MCVYILYIIFFIFCFFLIFSSISCVKIVTCVELFEDIIFGEIRIQVGYVADVPDTIAQAADFKIFLGEGLDVLDLLSTI